MNYTEMIQQDVNWIQLAQDQDQWQDPVRMVTHIWVQYKTAIVSTTSCTIGLSSTLHYTVYSQIWAAPESKPHPGFGDFLNEKKLVRDSKPHLPFYRPLPTGRLTE
jgi:hypothetical protein